jgi:uncharacterized protein (TIGR03118 family)
VEFIAVIRDAFLCINLVLEERAMGHVFKSLKSLAVLAVAIGLLPTVTKAQHYTQTNLVSNIAGQAPLQDPNLQNAWGLVSSPTGSPWWVSNNADGTSTLYSISATSTGGLEATLVPINPAPNEFVKIPNAPSQTPPGSPTGVMFNGSPTDFLLAPGAPALFMFVTEDGTVQGWNPGVNRASAVIKADNSKVPNAANGAVYKGSTIAEIDGHKFILAANFRSGRIDIFDTNFKQVLFSEEKFDDDSIPRDFAPFNVQGVGPNIYVTYAKQDAAKHDPVQPGRPGDGFVDVFDRHGKLLQRLDHGDWFNAPWGVVWATPDFGEFSNTILIGNFRGDNVAAFNPVTGHFLGNMLNPDGSTLLIDGLWALRFGNDGSSGPATTLFFTAGPNDETNGLLGTLTPIAAEKAEADEQ